MAKSKDPEVVEEMRAAGKLPEEEASEAEAAGSAAPESKSGRAKKSKPAGKPAGTAPVAEDAVEADKAAAQDVAKDEWEDLLAAAREEARADSAGEPATEAADDLTIETEIAGTEKDGTDHPGIHDDLHFPHAADQHSDHHDDHGHRSFAATALTYLVGVIVVASATLWAAPKVAPHVPASIGQYLMPGQLQTGAEIETLRQQLAEQAAQSEARMAELQTRLDAAAARLDALPDPEAAAGNSAEALKLAQDAGAQVAALKTQADSNAAELAGLRDSVSAVNAVLSGANGTAAPAELAAAVAGINARIENLSQSAATRPDLDAVSARIDALEANAAAAGEAQSKALGEVSTAIRQASLRSAVAALTSHLEGGRPYEAPLNEIVALTGSEAPAALTGAAAGGLSTPASLDASFGPRAQAAVSADVQARAGEGASSQVMGWLRAQVTGRPTFEQAGDDVGAITSRIAARLREGALAEALAEAETLPQPSQEALGPWLDRLRARVEAGAALSTWLTEIGANG